MASVVMLLPACALLLPELWTIQVFICSGVLAQTLTAVSLLDGTGIPGVNTGRIRVTVVDESLPFSGTVCEPVNSATATFLCNQLGFVASTRSGTVAQLNVPQGIGLIAMQNLDCTGAATLADCSFITITAATCTHSQDAALECSLTPGEVAGLVIGLLILFAILLSVPIIIICWCFCCGTSAICFTQKRYRL